MTNIEKFTEVFGFTPMDACIAPYEECQKYKYCSVIGNQEKCPYFSWWNNEYIENSEESKESSNEVE